MFCWSRDGQWAMQRQSKPFFEEDWEESGVGLEKCRETKTEIEIVLKFGLSLYCEFKEPLTVIFLLSCGLSSRDRHVEKNHLSRLSERSRYEGWKKHAP